MLRPRGGPCWGLREGKKAMNWGHLTTDCISDDGGTLLLNFWGVTVQETSSWYKAIHDEVVV